MFEFRRLKQFVVVAEELNIGRAAVRLHMSQPPLTRSIHQLEESLNTPLFLRTPQGVELTSEGEVFLKEARKILLMVERSYELLVQAKRGEIGRLVIGYYGSVIFNLLPRIMADFKARCPSADLAVHNMNKNEQLQALREHRIHIGFARHVSDEPDMVIKTILHEPILVALPERHPLAKMPDVSLEDLIKEPLVVFPRSPRPSFADHVTSIFRSEIGFAPDIIQEADDAETCIALVGAGVGISLVPESLKSLQVPGVTYIPLSKVNLTSEVSYFHLAERRAPVLDAFLSSIRCMDVDTSY